MEKSPSKQVFKLRRAVALRKREKYDSISIGPDSNCDNLSTFSAEIGASSPSPHRPITLLNQHQCFSAGGSTSGSQLSSRKRRREYLDLDESNNESELVRFVLDTQGKLEDRANVDQLRCVSKQQSSPSKSAVLKEAVLEKDYPSLSDCSSQLSRSIQRRPTDQQDQFGLQKRRLVEEFQGLSLLNAGKNHNQRQGSPKKSQLIQVLNSVEFESDGGCDLADNSLSAQESEGASSQRRASSGSRTHNRERKSVDSSSESQKLNEKGQRRRRHCQLKNILASDSDEQIEQGKTAKQSQGCQVCHKPEEQRIPDCLDMDWWQEDIQSVTSESKLENKCNCSGKIKQNKKFADESSYNGGYRSKDYVRLEIADKDIREQVNKDFMGNNRSFFLDRAAQQHQNSEMMTDETNASFQNSHNSGRSRSMNTPTGVNSSDFSSVFQSNMSSVHHYSSGESASSGIQLKNCCNNEIELRDRVLSSKRMLLRNFFSQYIKSLMMVNEKLNMSYLAKLKREYMAMREADKITVSEIDETIDEMMVDEQSRAQLYSMLSEQTNMRDLLMTDEGSASDQIQTYQTYTASAAMDTKPAAETGEDGGPWEYVFRNQGQPFNTNKIQGQTFASENMVDGGAQLEDIYMDVVE